MVKIRFVICGEMETETLFGCIMQVLHNLLHHSPTIELKKRFRYPIPMNTDGQQSSNERRQGFGITMKNNSPVTETAIEIHCLLNTLMAKSKLSHPNDNLINYEGIARRRNNLQEIPNAGRTEHTITPAHSQSTVSIPTVDRSALHRATTKPFSLSSCSLCDG